MKKLFLFVMMACAIPFLAQAQRFALIDMEYIMQNITEYERATTQMENLSKQRQAEIDKISNEAKTMYQSYQSETKLTAAQKKAKDDAIVAKEKQASELRRKYFGPEGELAKKRQELIEPIQNEIYEVVKAIAQRKGYSLVLDRASATSVIFASPNIDISDEVLSQLGANSN